VNGKIVQQEITMVTDEDVIEVDGVRATRPRMYYLLLNKPSGYTTTMADPHATRTVMSLLPETGYTLRPVGRLDKETEGLLIFSNDGEFIHKLTHPKFEVSKTYVARLKGLISDRAIQKLEQGVVVDGKKTLPADVKLISLDQEREQSNIEMVIHEGRNRQVRKMCLAVGFPVKKLVRTRIGNLSVKNLPLGACRRISYEEVDQLLKKAHPSAVGAPTRRMSRSNRKHEPT
jgi:23S rRNA pseudouridine2605 synthase